MSYVATGGKGRIKWDIPMSVKVRDGYRRFLQLLYAEMAGVAREMESFAKRNHKWRNQTGKAERTFTVRVISQGVIEASHGVHYGKWLELRWGGRLAVLPMTLQEGNRLMQRAMATAWIGAWGFR